MSVTRLRQGDQAPAWMVSLLSSGFPVDTQVQQLVTPRQAKAGAQGLLSTGTAARPTTPHHHHPVWAISTASALGWSQALLQTVTRGGQALAAREKFGTNSVEALKRKVDVASGVVPGEVRVDCCPGPTLNRKRVEPGF